jgi:hypothetical protein
MQDTESVSLKAINGKAIFPDNMWDTNCDCITIQFRKAIDLRELVQLLYDAKLPDFFIGVPEDSIDVDWTDAGSVPPKTQDTEE